jgi:DNA-binding IclR family transcriptional regulator
MQALEVLAFQPSSAPQLADILRVDARTARRLLNRLTDEGWLMRMEGRVRMYTLSLRLVALAAHFAERAPVARAAAGAVVALHERTGCTAHLTVPSYRSILCLVHSGGADARPRLRELVPAHASAGGKVLLGHRDPWRESVLELPLERLTDRTITDPDALREACAVAMERGFAIEDGEYREGLQSVAAPVRDEAGDVVAAVALTGPRADNVLGQAPLVREAAAEVAAKLAEGGTC